MYILLVARLITAVTVKLVAYNILDTLMLSGNRKTFGATLGVSSAVPSRSFDHKMSKGQNYSLIPQAGFYDLTIDYLYDRPLISG